MYFMAELTILAIFVHIDMQIVKILFTITKLRGISGIREADYLSLMTIETELVGLCRVTEILCRRIIFDQEFLVGRAMRQMTGDTSLILERRMDDLGTLRHNIRMTTEAYLLSGSIHEQLALAAVKLVANRAFTVRHRTVRVFQGGQPRMTFHTDLCLINAKCFFPLHRMLLSEGNMAVAAFLYFLVLRSACCNFAVTPARKAACDRIGTHLPRREAEAPNKYK